MSNYRNVLSATRRSHRERSQPQARARLGLLEKHKDYTERAKNFHEKERMINKLALKASLRNPDEFYHAMSTSSTKGGLHQAKRTAGEPANAKKMKNMKSQDKEYLVMKIQQDNSAIASSLGAVASVASAGAHVIFQESQDDMDNFKAEQYFDTDNALVSRKFNRPKLSDLSARPLLANANSSRVHANEVAASARERAGQLKQLNERIKRKRKLEEERDDLSTTLALMGGGQRKRVVVEDKETGKKKAVFKWKQERKK